MDQVTPTDLRTRLAGALALPLEGDIQTEALRAGYHNDGTTMLTPCCDFNGPKGKRAIYD